MHMIMVMISSNNVIIILMYVVERTTFSERISKN